MSAPNALTRKEFDQLTAAGCQTPGCDCKGKQHPYYLHAYCHPDAPIWVSYHNGFITVECGRCRKFVARIQLAT